MPQLPLSYALIGCFASCTLYAFLLNTKRGQAATLHVTWLTVIVGCALVLLFLAMADSEAARLALWFFMAGGTPIVIRSLWQTARNLWAYLLYRSGQRTGNE